MCFLYCINNLIPYIRLYPLACYMSPLMFFFSSRFSWVIADITSSFCLSFDSNSLLRISASLLFCSFFLSNNTVAPSNNCFFHLKISLMWTPYCSDNWLVGTPLSNNSLSMIAFFSAVKCFLCFVWNLL